MIIVPLSPLPSQSLQIVLENQDCDVEIYTRGDRLYMNLAVDGESVQSGAICLNMTSVIQTPNSSFSGILMFFDMNGAKNPEYSELGSRYILTYWTEDEENAPIYQTPIEAV